MLSFSTGKPRKGFPVNNNFRSVVQVWKDTRERKWWHFFHFFSEKWSRFSISFLYTTTDALNGAGRYFFIFFSLCLWAQGGILGDSEAGINNEVDHTAGATLKHFLLKAYLNSTAGTIC